MPAVREQPARVDSGDILRGTYSGHHDGYVFVAQLDGPRADFSWEGTPEPFGHIIAGSAKSGAIWLHNDCIAEYEIERGSKIATITPVSDGRKQFARVTKADPVVFLLEAARAPGAKRGAR